MLLLAAVAIPLGLDLYMPVPEDNPLTAERIELGRRVWEGVSITDRVVDNHILNLRRKLEAAPTEPKYLLSVDGLGYRFGDPAENLTET